MSDRATEYSRPLKGAAVFALLVGFTVSGCGSSPPADPYGADFAAARKQATSEFEKGVLADGKITGAEYEEANQRWLVCMQETYPATGSIKVTLDPRPDGLYQYAVSGFPGGIVDAKYEPTDAKCQKGTIAIVATLFNNMKTNPENISVNAALVRCLKRSGLVPKSYTEENLRADTAKQGNLVVEQGPDGTESTHAAVAPDQSKVTGLDMTAAGVQKCIADPFSSATGG